MAVAVVRSPTGVADHVGLVVQHRLSFVEDQTILGNLKGGGAQPVIALPVVVGLQVDHDLAQIASRESAVDDGLDASEIVGRQARDHIKGKRGVRELDAGLSKEWVWQEPG